MNQNGDNRWIVRVVLVFVLIGVLIVVALLLPSTGARPRRVTISSDSNGSPVLLGVPLSNTNARDKVFQAMSAAGVKVAVAVPGNITNEAQQSNLLETLKSVSRAGLWDTNAARKSNPFD